MKIRRLIRAWPCAVLLIALMGSASTTSGRVDGASARFSLDSLTAISPLTGVAAMSAGDRHTCVVTTGGGVKCWGDNTFGQLGDGTTMHRGAPVDVVGLSSGVQAVAVGTDFSCALTAAASVKCWGRGDGGALGNGESTNSPTPVTVSNLTGQTQAIAAGVYHACALTINGAVKCWGNNGYNQLGSDDPRAQARPVTVSGLPSGVVSIAAGRYHNCVLSSNGGVQCWGANLDGALGDGTHEWRQRPVAVVGLGGGVKAIAANGHTCALMATGIVKCWGDNYDGQLGDGTTEDSLIPVDVAGLSDGVTQISLGASHTCAVVSEAVQCWGANFDGQLGDGTTGDRRATPRVVNGLQAGVVSVASGYAHSCALLTSGRLTCWGSDSKDQLGEGTEVHQTIPARVLGLGADTTFVSVGADHTCAASPSQGVKCWGSNRSGELGRETQTTVPQSHPERVSGLSGDVVALSVSGFSNCAVTSDGAAQCWGYNVSGQLGNGAILPSLAPAGVIGLSSGVASIDVGSDLTCAVLSGGRAQCWGHNDHGQLGNGTTNNRLTPGPVSGLSSGVSVISAGYSFACARTLSGAAECWGLNSTGQLGDGTATDHWTPGPVSGLTDGIQDVEAGWGYACALGTNGSVTCWGSNQYGQLGDGTTTTTRAKPVSVIGLESGVSAIAVGPLHACALKNSGAVFCWGNNTDGQLGDGTYASRSLAQPVVGLSGGVSQIVAGLAHSCAITLSHITLCWGSDGSSQLGLGTITSRTAPTVVVAGPVTSATVDRAYARPGTILTLRAHNVPGDRPPTIAVNGIDVMTEVLPTPTGEAILFLNTAGLTRGLYIVTVSTNPTASASFFLDDSAPLYAPAGGGSALALEGLGISPLSSFYQPSLHH